MTEDVTRFCVCLEDTDRAHELAKTLHAELGNKTASRGNTDHAPPPPPDKT